MKKQKAFTLIELLSVIVILAIISLIAIPIVLNIVGKVKQSSLESSANGLVESAKLYYFNNLEAVKEEVVFDCNQNGCHNAAGEKLEFSGKIEAGKLVLNKNGKALVCVDDGEKYAYIKDTTVSGNGLCGDYEEGEFVILDKNGKRNGRIILSEKNPNISYPNTKKIEIIENLSNGELSVTTSNEEVVKVKLEGNEIIMEPVSPTGTATITVTSGEIGSYIETTITYTVTVKLGTLDITVNGYNGLYDKGAHGITVASSGANITYATEENGTYSDINPTFTDVGTYTVWYKVEKYGYEVVIDSATVNISPSDKGLILPKYEDVLSATTIEAATVQYQVENESGGVLSVASSDEEVATATITQEGLLTVTSGTKPGNATITVTSEVNSTNYLDSAATLEITVEIVCGYNNGHSWDFAYTGSKSDFVIPCDGTYKLEVWGAQGGTGYTNSKNTIKTVSGGSYSSLSLSSSTFTRTNGTYYFSTSGTPNNLGVASSTATTTWTASSAIDVKVEITYVTESNYDKISVSIAGSTKISSASGSGTQSVRGSLDAGDTIVVKYTKDGSVDATNESVTVKFYKETTAGTESSSYGSWKIASSQAGGKGGYSVGTTNFETGTNLYVYVGGEGGKSSSTSSATNAGGFNGGGTSYNRKSSNILTNGGGGGGATDIRIGTDSLYSRVIVAGGGGGGSGSSDSSKYGGGESGGSPTEEYIASITAPGTNGSFGIGATASGGTSYKYGPGGGGGGWYGGGASDSASSTSTYRKYNGGGSGWVYTASNFETWNAGDSANAANYLLNSRYYLSDAQTIAGNVSFISPTGTSETGHSSNGYARITLISLDESE